MFYDCSGLTTLDLSNFVTPELTNTASMFRNCSKLVSVNLDNFVGTKIKDMSYMFNNCSQITNINLNNFNTPNLRFTQYMFDGCVNLKTLDLSNLNNYYTVHHINGSSSNGNGYYMFNNCIRLKEIKVSNNFEFSSYEKNLLPSNYTGYWYNKDTGEKFTSETVPDKVAATYVSYSNEQTGMLAVNLYRYLPSGNRLIFTDIVSPADVTTDDVSAAQDGSILAWSKDNVCYVSSTETGRKVLANYNSSNMLREKSSLTAIDFTNLDTSLVTDMSYIFYGCNGLTSLNLSGLNTQNVTNMSYSFYGLSNKNFTTLDLTSLNTSKVENMSYMCYLPYATEINLDSLNMENVTDMSYMFYRCYRANEINFNNVHAPKVTTMAHMFDDCNALTSLDLSSLKPQNLQNLNNMFYECSKITTINLANFNTSKVTDMQDMFRSCSLLTNVNISSFDVSSVTTMSGMFAYCYALTDLNLEHFTTSKVTTLQMMFAGCSGLESLNISNLDTSKVTSMSSMFSGCSSIVNLDLSKWNTREVLYIGSMFKDCTNLETLDLTGWHLIELDPSYSGLFTNCKNLERISIDVNFNYKYNCARQLPIPDPAYIDGADGKWYDLNTCIGYSPSSMPKSWGTQTTTFVATPNILTGIISVDKMKADLPTTVTKIIFTDDEAPLLSETTDISALSNNSVVGWKEDDTYYISTQQEGLKVSTPGNISSMFKDLTNLIEIDFSNLDTSNATNMGSFFYGCTNLKEINLAYLDTSKVTSMINMFNGCQSLETIDVSTFNTSNLTSIGRMFQRCHSLTTIDLSNWDLSNIGSMYGAFSTNNLLETVIFSEQDTPKLNSMGYMFYNNPALKNIDMSGLTSDAFTDTAYMFYNCPNLESVKLGEFTAGSSAKMNYMFYNCKKLTEVDMSKMSTSQVTEMSNMFMNCSSLRTLDLSNITSSRVKNMNYMFYGCSNLETLDISQMTTSWYGNTMNYMFNGCNKLSRVVFRNGFGGFKGTNPYLPTPNSAYITGADGYWYNELTQEAYKSNSVPASNYQSSSDKLVYVAVATWNSDKLNRNFRQTVPSNATTIVFTDIIAPDNTELTDVSALSNGAIMAWLDGTTYYVSTQQEGVKVKTQKDASYLFANLKNIQNIDFTNLDTSNTVNMSHIFEESRNLTSINLSNFNTSNVTNISYMFNYCSNLDNINLNDIDTSNIDNMSHLFNGCIRLSNLNISNLNTSNVTDMSYMFADCWSLESLDLSNFNTSNVNNMDYMFAGYDDSMNLKYINLSSFDTSNVWSMEGMFRDCSNLKTLDLGNFDTSSVYNMSWMFGSQYKPMSLETINLSSFSARWLTDTRYMFANNKALKELDLSHLTLGTGYSDVDYIYMDYMFVDCTNLETLDISSAVFANSSEGMFAGCKKLKDLSVGNIGSSNTSYMFADCESLTEIDLSKITYLGNMSHMFENCKGLTNIDLIITGRIYSGDMSYAFSGCENLASITLDFDTTNFNTMENMFNNCNAINQITLGANFAFVGTDGYLPDQYGCYWYSQSTGEKYTNTTIPNNVADTYVLQRELSATLIDGQSFGNTIPENATTIIFTTIIPDEDIEVTDLSVAQDEGIVGWLEDTTYYISTRANVPIIANSDSSYLFYGNASGNGNGANLEFIDLSNLSTKNTTNMEYMFKGCNELQAVIIGKNFSFLGDGTIITTTQYLPESSSGYWYSYTTGNAYTSNTIPNNVYDLYAISNPNYIMQTGIYEYVPEDVTSVIFTDDVAPENVELIDLSDLQNNSVVGWLAENTFYISTQVDGQKVIAPTDMSHMFHDYQALETVNVTNLDVSNTEYLNWMFAYCTNLTEIIGIEDWNVSKVVDMYSMFNNCMSLKSLDLSQWNTSNVESMGWMFNNCIALESITFGDTWNTSNTVDMSHMFHDCQSLKTIDVSNFDVSNTEYINWMFAYCTNLTEIIGIENWDTSNVIDMFSLFDSCTSLIELDLTNWSTESLEYQEGMFWNCLSLSKIILGENFEFISEDSYLPEPDSEYIEGASGVWYNSNGYIYLPFEIPSNIADTYIAVKPLTSFDIEITPNTEILEVNEIYRISDKVISFDQWMNASIFIYDLDGNLLECASIADFSNDYDAPVINIADGLLASVVNPSIGVTPGLWLAIEPASLETEGIGKIVISFSSEITEYTLTSETESVYVEGLGYRISNSYLTPETLLNTTVTITNTNGNTIELKPENLTILEEADGLYRINNIAYLVTNGYSSAPLGIYFDISPDELAANGIASIKVN